MRQLRQVVGIRRESSAMGGTGTEILSEVWPTRDPPFPAVALAGGCVSPRQRLALALAVFLCVCVCVCG